MFDSESVGGEDLKIAANTGRFSELPRPFLRWAGSKQSLMGQLLPLIPKTYGRYFEPFLGSGALFLRLRPKRATLSDASKDLIELWKALETDVDSIIEYLRPLKPDRELYYKIRENRSTNEVTRAAELMYLNKACWNGLYRVNSSGKFNVPYGAPRSDFIFDEDNLRACSKLLKRSTISLYNQDFDKTLSRAREGDLVYLDPPYVTKHNNNGFRDWNERLFRWDDQVRLSETAERLRKRGVVVIVSNANHADIASLYPNFAHQQAYRSSTLSSNSIFRGKVSELIMTANGS
jgi:DNA adenine methylase